MFKRLMLCACAAAVTAFTSVATAQTAMFNYQGRVKVQGQPFAGTGQFKFALVSTNGQSVLWTHDGSTGGVDGEPTGSVSLTVTDGIFNVMVGETTPPLSMQAINSSIFNTQTPLKLRVWFSDGSGFEKLNPDTNLVNLSLIITQTGTSDYTIYVDGTNGDDDNNGLTPATAKKTIQAAVDIVPKSLSSKVTIDIAPGVYREEVQVFGISGPSTSMSSLNGTQLQIVGDQSWTPSSVGDPDVKITGSDNDIAAVRNFGLFAQQCAILGIEGVHFDRTVQTGVWFENGSYRLEGCKTTNSSSGISATVNSNIHVIDCESSNHTIHGFGLARNSFAEITNLRSHDNGARGVDLSSLCGAIVYSGNFSNNNIGVWAQRSANVQFPAVTNQVFVHNNSVGVQLTHGSWSTGYVYVNLSGNTTDLVTSPGGNTY